MKPLSILATDDQSLFREGLSLVLQRLFPAAKLKQAGSGPEALESLKQNRFDLLLLDIGMPEMNGMVVAQQVLKLHPDVRIIILTQYNGEAMTAHLLRMG